ncbi:hypothetical protein EBZ80_23865 [bacterium]|nr:hypothetical protein [bacterium]
MNRHLVLLGRLHPGHGKLGLILVALGANFIKLGSQAFQLRGAFLALVLHILLLLADLAFQLLKPGAGLTQLGGHLGKRGLRRLGGVFGKFGVGLGFLFRLAGLGQLVDDIIGNLNPVLQGLGRGFLDGFGFGLGFQGFSLGSFLNGLGFGFRCRRLIAHSLISLFSVQGAGNSAGFAAISVSA